MAAVLLVVRHALAVDRDDWPHDDDERPLNADGERQAGALAAWLPHQSAGAHGRLLSSPTRRCLATLEPYAIRSGRPVEACDDLRPGRETEAAELARHVLAAGGGVLCTHGEVIPGLLAALADGLDGPPPADSEKGSVWILRPSAGAGAESPAGLGARCPRPRLQGRYLGPERLAHEAAG